MSIETQNAADLAIGHWNETPLLLTEQQRYSFYPWLYEAAEFRHHRGERVLELGCGTGCDLLQFARNGCEAVGVDLTPEHVRLARERVGNAAHIYRADIRQLPFASESFDYIYSHGVIHHSDEPRRIVDELLRVLRPGGKFNVQVYNRWSLAALAYIVKHGRKWRVSVENSEAPVHIDLYTPGMLRRLFAPQEIQIRRYECHYGQWLGPYVGWYLVATGTKPAGRR
jgi:SAM-dependent methyltransferase